jgi:hypothetical protein
MDSPDRLDGALELERTRHTLPGVREHRKQAVDLSLIGWQVTEVTADRIVSDLVVPLHRVTHLDGMLFPQHR